MAATDSAMVQTQQPAAPLQQQPLPPQEQKNKKDDTDAQ